MRKILFFSLLISLFLQGCDLTKYAAKRKEIFDSYLNHHKSELIQNWGPPTRRDDDGKGGEILIYERKVTTGAVFYGTYRENTQYPSAMFYSDKNGNIYFWRDNGY